MDDIPSTGEGPTILIIETEVAIQKILAAILTKHDHDYQLVFCDDPQKAVQLAKTKYPDAIIIDPLNSNWGVDVCWELQTHPPTNEIPIICLTYLGCVGWDVVLAELRFAGIVGKPFRSDTLLDTLQVVLNTPVESLPKLEIKFNSMAYLMGRLTPRERREWKE
jgi:DNA-binding response OmpR family regulator